MRIYWQKNSSEHTHTFGNHQQSTDEYDNAFPTSERNQVVKRFLAKKEERDKTPDPFLDKLALRSTSFDNTAEKQAKKNFLLQKFCVIDTTKPFHYKWLFVITLAVLYNLNLIIARAVFWELQNQYNFLWNVLDYVGDFIYLADISVRSREGFLEDGILVEDTSRLRRKYVRSRYFLLDVLSLTPTDISYLWLGTECRRVPCPAIVRLNRVVRVYRANEFFAKSESRTSLPNLLRICKVVLVILILIHWNACFYFAFSYYIGFGSDKWVYNTTDPKGDNYSLGHQYIYSFYWSTLTLTTIGETPPPEEDVEFVFVTVDFLMGVLIFATIVGNIGSMISNMNATEVEFQNKMDGVKQYMKFRKVSKELQKRVLSWFDYLRSNRQGFDEEILASLPDKLKAEIAIHVHLDTLKCVSIFKNCEPGLLVELVLKLKLQVFSPGDYICRKGDVGKEMYIVKKGRLEVVSEDGRKVFVTLGEGSVFGEVSILNIAGNRTGNRRTANVRSVGYSDVFCLSKKDLWDTLGDYPEAKKNLIESGRQLLMKDGLLDLNATSEEDENKTFCEKFVKLEKGLDEMQARFTRMWEEYSCAQHRLMKRIARLEKKRQLMTKSESEVDES